MIEFAPQLYRAGRIAEHPAAFSAIGTNESDPRNTFLDLSRD